MAVKIRLARRGRKRYPLYDVVVADARAPRDGRFIEKLGTYNPNTAVATINLDENRAFHWLMVGAQPTDTVRAMLSYRGLLYKKHLQIGVEKGALSQEDADKKFQAWLDDKNSRISDKEKSLADKVAADKKAKLEAEAKVSEARAEALKAKQAEADAAAKAEETPEEATEAETDEAPSAEATEEAPAAEATEEKKED